MHHLLPGGESCSSLSSARGEWCCELIGCLQRIYAPSRTRTLAQSRTAGSALTLAPPQTHTHARTRTRTHLSAALVCTHNRPLQPVDFTWTRNSGGTNPTRQCELTAWRATASCYYLCGNRGGVSAHAITMDCVFLLIWTLPIPLVGCTSVKLLSTFLTWNSFKAWELS